MDLILSLDFKSWTSMQLGRGARYLRCMDGSLAHCSYVSLYRLPFRPVGAYRTPCSHKWLPCGSSVPFFLGGWGPRGGLVLELCLCYCTILVFLIRGIVASVAVVVFFRVVEHPQRLLRGVFQEHE